MATVADIKVIKCLSCGKYATVVIFTCGCQSVARKDANDHSHDPDCQQERPFFDNHILDCGGKDEIEYH